MKTEKRQQAAALQKLLLGGCGFAGFHFGSGVGVLFGEAFDAAGGVNQLLLASEEGMAIRADFYAQHVALDGRTSLKRVAAGAVHRNRMIIGMNAGFHWVPFVASGLHGVPSCGEEPRP